MTVQEVIDLLETYPRDMDTALIINEAYVSTVINVYFSVEDQFVAFSDS